MGIFGKYMSVKRTENDNSEYLHINFNTGRIKGKHHRYYYQDKDSLQFVVTIPSLEISGYGATKEKAEEMLKFSMDDLFKILISSSHKKTELILVGLGWKHNRYKNKEYSKAYVDSTGELQDFAVENSIKAEMMAY